MNAAGELTFTNGRTANHVLITDSGKAHFAADARTRPYHVLACNGRAMTGAGVGLASVAELTFELGQWCAACYRLETVNTDQEVAQS